MVTLKYLDHRKIFFPKLTFYKKGLNLPSESNIIKVTEGEAKTLLKLKNGSKFCYEKFEEILTEKKPKNIKVEIKEDIKEAE